MRPGVGHVLLEGHNSSTCKWCLNTDLKLQLELIERLAQLAREALADEREGELRTRIVDLHTRAAACLHVVATW